MSYPSDDTVRDKADEVMTEAAFAKLSEPPQASGPPASYGGGVDSSGDAGFDTYKSEFKGVKDVFENFLTPDPSLFRSQADDASGDNGLSSQFKIPDSGKGLMKERFPGVDILETAINNSCGDAFNNFSNNFLDKFDLIWFNHASVTKALGLAADAVAKIYEQARRDLIDIGDLTIALLKEAQEPAGDPTDGRKSELTVISEASGAIALIATPLPPVSIAAEGVSVVAKLAAFGADDEKNDGHESNGEYTITGFDARGIVDSMYLATSALEADVATALRKAKKNLAAYNNALESPQLRRYFVIPDVNFPTKADV